MPMLSDDDINLREMSAEELEAAWDLWFDLAQTTNAWDPPFSHGVFVNTTASDAQETLDPPLAGAPPAPTTRKVT